MKNLRTSFILLIILTLFLGLIYPALVWVAGQTLFEHKANGSLIFKNGNVVGSALLGQHFTSNKYFWSRPSATPSFPYNAMSSGASNLNPANPALFLRVERDIRRLQQANDTQTPVPIDLVTTSGSGLDPHITPEAALFQVKRVAKARGIDPDKLEAFVHQFVVYPTIYILGESRVNVLLLNLSLDIKEGALR